MAKKKSKSKIMSRSKKRVYLVAVIIGAVAMMAGIGGVILFINRQQSVPASEVIIPMSPATVDARRDRIEAIYDSLKLTDTYTLVGENVFGAKKQYSYDKGRTFSSEKRYVHDAAVDVTANELKKKIEAAGFTYFDEPYPGSTVVQYHFKSIKGEYIRLTVSSKPRDDDIYARHKTDEKFFELDPNAGPSNVIIKVNLDDNNE
jgi:hypothetical protein